MHEAEGMNFKVDFLKKPLTGKDQKKLKPTYRTYTVDEIVYFINNSTKLSVDEKQKLIKIAKSIPVGALGKFKEDHRKYLKKNKK
jgi:hypothetical protein